MSHTNHSRVDSRHGALFLSLCLLLVIPGIEGCRRTSILSANEVPARAIEVFNELDAQFDVTDGGYGAALVLTEPNGAAGAVAFAERQADGNRLHVARFRIDDSSLTDEVIADSVGDNFDLVVDAGGRLMVVGATILPGGTANLTLWREQGGGGWKTIPLDESEDTGRFVAATTSPDGAIHVAYIASDSNEVRYLSWLDDLFLTQPSRIVIVDRGAEAQEIVPGGIIDFGVSIALLPDQRPIISYYDAENGQLRTAVRDLNTLDWAIQVVAYTVQGELLGVDSDGRASVPQGFIPRKEQITVYADGQPLDDSEVSILDSQTLQIASPQSGVEYTVDLSRPISADYGRWSSLAVAGDGLVGLSFYDLQGGRVMYAASEQPESMQGWSVQVADDRGIVGGVNRLTFLPLFDRDGIRRGDLPVIVYRDVGRSDLMAAVRIDGAWNVMRVVTTGLSGYGADVAAGDDGWLTVVHREHEPVTFYGVPRILRIQPIAP